MNRSVLTIIASVVTVASIGLSAVPASADTPGCVTRKEWRTIYVSPDGYDNGPGTGGRLARVHRVFDTHGTRTWFYGDDPTFEAQVRKYRKCNDPNRRYSVTFHRYKQNGHWSSWWSYWG